MCFTIGIEKENPKWDRNETQKLQPTLSCHFLEAHVSMKLHVHVLVVCVPQRLCCSIPSSKCDGHVTDCPQHKKHFKLPWYV